MRDQWARGRASGRRVVEAAARHIATDKLVGYTDLAVSAASPTLGYQQDTLVVAEHRGHGLGLSLKLAALAALRRELPGVRSIRTWNAASNLPMLQVNRAIGFVVTGYGTEWEKRLNDGSR